MAEKYKNCFTSKKFLLAIGVAVLLFAASLVVNFYAGTYATDVQSGSVTDIVLSNTRAYDLESIFVYGPVFLWVFVSFLGFSDPQKIPFIIKSIALFVIIRSIFVSLTHLGPFPTSIAIDYTSSVVKKFTFGGDLFFSAHTGLPFLMALIFGENLFLFVVFTIVAIFFGAVVLLAHLHYSIDVLAAFFITYAIFQIAKKIFSKDWKIFKGELSHLN